MVTIEAWPNIVVVCLPTLLKILSHLKCVATLPCKNIISVFFTSMFTRYWEENGYCSALWYCV